MQWINLHYLIIFTILINEKSPDNGLCYYRVIYLKKRAIISFCALVFIFASVAVRLSVIIKSSTLTVDEQKNEKSITVNTIKGQIWDCNRNPLVNTSDRYYAAILPTDEGVDFVNRRFTAEEANAVKERLLNGKPVCEPLSAYAKGNNAIHIITTANRYADNQTAAHIIGYIDSSGNGTGIEKSYQSFLEESSFSISAVFGINGRGQAMAGNGITVINEDKSQNSGVILTLDRTMQQISESILKQNQVECGAVVIADVNTGDIKAMASCPTFNPNNIAASLQDENSPLLNRALQSYTVGSVFKPVIAAAALEHGINKSQSFTCNGAVNVNRVTFHCHKEEGHNTVDLKGAIAQSCNLYFIQLSALLPRSVIIEKAAEFGFGKEIELAEAIRSRAGNLPDAEDLDSDAAKANLSFGQGTLLATPLQINAMTVCLANGGIYRTPRLVIGTVNENGAVTYKPKGESHRVIQEETATILCECLRAVITEGTGKRAAPENIAVAGKTATAQTGRYDETGEQHNAWFTGYFPYDNPQYAVTVLIENGGEGALTAAPIFRQIVEALIEFGAA